MNRKFTTRNIAMYGLFMALVTVFTMVVSIPSIATQGYVNLGDGLVLLSGLVLGPLAGFIIGGLGSALADILLAYAYYAPYTLVIKGIEGFLGVYLYKKYFKEKNLIIPMLIGGTFMAIGYLIVEIYLYSFPGAIASLPGNLIQGFVGAVVATALHKAIKNKIVL